MTQRAPRPPSRPSVFVLPVGLIVRTVAVSLGGLALIGVMLSGVIGRAAGGTSVADASTVALHQAAAERDLDAGYVAATEQVKKARSLKLAISAQQADAIATKALTDLATLRHSALLSIGQTLGMPADGAEAYARSTEQAMDARRGQPQPSVAPVLLAPRLFSIVSRFNDIATQLSDQATADLTQSVAPTPTPSPSATPTFRPTPTPISTR